MTVGVTCFFTTILYVIPTVVVTVLQAVNANSVTEVATLYRAISVNLSAVVDTLVITMRQNDIKTALAKLLPGCCRSKVHADICIQLPKVASRTSLNTRHTMHLY